jgi:Flp pilus assembly secretin CpaC
MRRTGSQGSLALRQCVAVLLLATFSSASLAQEIQNTPQQAPRTVQRSKAGQPAASTTDGKQVSGRARRHAAKIFLNATKLFQTQRFEEAMHAYQAASTLDPGNLDYRMAIEVARNHAVTALIQQAAKERIGGDAPAARATLAHARELNPNSAAVTSHLYDLSDDAIAGMPAPLYEKAAESIAAAPELSHTPQTQSFHLHTNQRDVMKQVFKTYGVEITFDESVRPIQIHFDLDDASYAQALRALALTTQSFFVPMDPHRVFVARDNRDNRQKFDRQDMETISISGLSATELADIGKLAKDVFGIEQSAVNSGAETITLRGPASDLNAFNVNVSELLQGRDQVILDVRVIQLAHNSTRNTGAQLPQTMTAYNLYSEEQSILSSNSALVSQIISSGLAAPGDTLAIIGILVASGEVSSSLFGNGIATFGGGITSSALAPGSDTFNLNLNSSDSRALDRLQLRLGDGEEGKLRLGERYPIQTSSFSSGVNTSAIAGLTGAGTSSALTSLLSSLAGSVATIPMIEYQDIGLTLQATPKIVRSGDVALTLDMKITSLAGSSVNGVPILDNQSYSGVVTLKNGEGVVVVQELDKSQSKAVNGTPGISEIPGLNDLTDKDTQKNYATLLIIMTPRLVRATPQIGHTPIMRVESVGAR